MKYRHFNKKSTIFSLILGMFVLSLVILPVSQVEAAGGNLIKNPSFEQGSVDTYWYVWNSQPQSRTYTMYRSYDVPFGNGSYSAAIDATGPAGSLYDGGLVTNPERNPFTVTAGKTYYFSLYVKASSPTTLSVYLEKTDNFQSLGAPQEISVGTNWEKKQVIFRPSETASAYLGMAFGGLATNGTLNIDGLDLSENTLTLTTKNIGGYIGQTKSLALANGNRLTVDDVRIELPYFNPDTNTTERRSFAPSTMQNGNATFTIPNQTFSGVGKVYVMNSVIDSFDYNVWVKITDISPDPVRPDEDLVVYGTGFQPDLSKEFVLVKGVGQNGATYDSWIAPHTVDSALSQLVVKLPVGMTNSALTVRTYFTNLAGNSVENKSNGINYTVQPMIYGVYWSERGHEHVGDKISIQGKGIVNRPVVYFYNQNNVVVAKKNATVKKIVTGAENYEIIEVATPVNLNQVSITVKVGPNESDKASALQYNAKPLLKSIRANHSRKLANTGISLPAAKVGETIRLNGNGFKTSGSAYVEFWSIRNAVITVPVDTAHIDPNGNWVDVVVPVGAQSGEINVQINGQKSNNASLEIIPTIVSSQPIEPVPGSNLTLTVQGTSLEPSQITVYFKLPNNQEVAVHPSSVTKSGDNVLVTILVPRAIPNQGATLRIQYGYWLNDETYRVSAAPHIQEASLNTESKVLTIKGYGFSSNASSNKITYKYADGTVVTPKVKMLGVFTTSEGQEIRVKILDTYSYGSVFVTVGEDRSNEVTVGPAVISRIERRVQYVAAEGRVMGVLYITGRNFGPRGDVQVGRVWANTHYRSNTFIIAVVEQNQLYGNPVIVTKR